jgi:V8-like Glu-specific endopeptidase
MKKLGTAAKVLNLKRIITSLSKITSRRAIPVAFVAASFLAGTSFLATSAASAGTVASHGARAVTEHSAASLVRSPGKVMSAKATLAYWTRARLRAAKPVSVLTVSPKALRGATSARPTGKPSRVQGGLPEGASAEAAAGPLGSQIPLQFSYPYPYDIFQVPNSYYTAYPWELNGKLFFSNDGGSYVCSATSVGSYHGTSLEDEIWTAGHCAVNTSGTTKVWDSSAIFIPAYNGTVTNFDPFGEFVYDGQAETSTAWYDNSDLSEDEAAMIVDNSTTTGRTLGQAVGWDGFAWNYPVDEQFVAFGYPAASPYNGLTMWQDLAPTGAQNCLSGEANSVCPIAIGNPMTGGSSGGAWNIDWSLSGPGYIDGHNDFKFTSPSEPLAMSSPYQDTLSNEVRCFGASSC